MKSFEAAISILSDILSGEAESSPGGGRPNSTRYRHIDALRRAGLVFRAGPDTYVPHPAFLTQLESFNRLTILSETIRPALRSLARSVECTAHFGVFENDMVTYLVKESATQQDIFTRELQQLEAYCSGIGKVLLSRLPNEDFETYLNSGPFPALTSNTKTEPRDIRKAIEATRSEGYAVDDAEVHQNLFCLAMPAFDGVGRCIGALSVSSTEPTFMTTARRDGLSALIDCRDKIATRLK